MFTNVHSKTFTIELANEQYDVWFEAKQKKSMELLQLSFELYRITMSALENGLLGPIFTLKLMNLTHFGLSQIHSLQHVCFVLFSMY